MREIAKVVVALDPDIGSISHVADPAQGEETAGCAPALAAPARGVSTCKQTTFWRLLNSMLKHHRTCFAALAAVGALAWAQVRNGDVMLFNSTASMPIGLYVRSNEPVSTGAIVTIHARDAAPGLASERGFDVNDRFLKRIAGAGGDRVCATANVITINDETVALRRALDNEGRALPAWQGCSELAVDQVFLLGDAVDSFDSRYFGPVSIAELDGVWRPLGN